MGEKELMPGFLVFPDGTKVAVAEAPALSPANYEYDDSEMIDFTSSLRTPIEGSVELHEVEFSPILLWQLLTGMPITNNYLKMHGGVILRRRQIRKIRRK